MSFLTVQSLRKVSLRHLWLCSASEFSRGVPGFKILIKSYLTYYLNPVIKDSPGATEKNSFLCLVQNDAKK